jgi:tryptophan-rich sensory protein
MMSWTSTTLVPITVAALAALAVALAGGLATQIGPWYQQLAKPSWQPPDWLFGPVWTVIFALIALAGARAWWDVPPGGERQAVIVLFAVNGVLNVLWSVLFFALRRPDWALIEVAFLWLSILVLIVVIGRYSAVGAWLLVPYLVWVSFASFLNWTIVRLNAPF